MTDLPPPTSKWPQAVRLVGGPDDGVIAPFGGAYIEPSRVIHSDGRILPAAAGRYEYRQLASGGFIAEWCRDAS
jgi:hypothetical protein